jgi:hypothetical protein
MPSPKKEAAMKKLFICFLTIGFALLIYPSSYAQSGKMGVVGTWKLISIEQERFGEIQPDEWLGKKPTGIIMYDTTGYMSVQLMRDPQEQGALDKYYAYFGTYELEVKEGTEGKEGVVLHHLQGSLDRYEIGLDYKRRFKISGNRIMLTTPGNRRLTFERVEKGK